VRLSAFISSDTRSDAFNRSQYSPLAYRSRTAARLRVAWAAHFVANANVAFLASRRWRMPATFLPGPVRLHFNTSERKFLHAIARTYGLRGGHGAWWFWPRRHH
jgi:hypothetical protein